MSEPDNNQAKAKSPYYSWGVGIVAFWAILSGAIIEIPDQGELLLAHLLFILFVPFILFLVDF